MKSMTGFGRSKLEKNLREYVIEIKSVNYKYNDIIVKMPRSLTGFEEKIKKIISNNISRGKVDVSILFTNYSIEGKEIVINKELARTYITELKELADQTGITDKINVTEITNFPDVMQLKISDEDSEIIGKELEECANIAVQNFINMREKEGTKIKEDLEKRLNKIQVMIDKISKFSAGLIENYVVKLRERIKEILATDIIDEVRLAQEIVIYSDKCSIEEELTRLNSHINQLRGLFESTEAVGKKMDFIIQEMNREINTIASKSIKLEITNLVIEVKTELENIREQIQNVE